MRYLHDVNDTPIFAEVARRAIADISGDEITATYMKKTDIEYDYNSKGEIVGINSSAIAAGAGGVEISGTDGIYVQNEIGRKIIGISADIATQSDLSGKQDTFSQETLDDIYSIPLKLDSTAFSDVSGSFATSADIQEAIENLGPLHIVGEATCDEINAMTGMKAGDVYSITDSGTIDGKSVMAGDEVAYTTSDNWIIIGRDVALDLTAYYRKDETSGANELASAFEEKQDLLEFSYNLDNQITAINSSAIAGGGSTIVGYTSGISKTVDDKLYIPLGTDLTYYYESGMPAGIQVNTNGEASGIHAFVEGTNTLAQGDASHAEGSATTAAGFASHAGGTSSIAAGTNAFAHGENNNAEGRNAVVFGRGSYASDNSFAAGNEVSASEPGSFAFGDHVQAGSGLFAIGKGNETTADALFVVGNGDPNGIEPTFSDAFVVDFSGNAYADGDVIAYSNDGSAISLAALDADYTQFTEEVAQFSGDLIDEVNSAKADVSRLEVVVESNSAFWDEVSAKLDTSAFSSVSGTFLTESAADELYATLSALDDKQDALTNEQISAISSVSSIKGTVLVGDSNIRTTSAEEGSNIKWTLELTAQPVVTDTTLSGYSGIVATKDSSISSQWNVGLAQGYVEAITSVSSIPVITKSDVDEIWAIVTGERV
jgi:hypothetical protein